MNNFNHCGGGFPAFGNHHDKPFDGEQKGLGKIFYKSDFSVWLADPTGDKTTPFTLTFYVGDLESTYTAGFDGLNYKRCKRNEDGSLLVFFDRHTLPCGRLMLRVEIDKVNPYYADGEQNTADKLPLPIILWDGATSYEPTMAYALAPYIVGADGKPFTYDDLTEEEKKDLGEKATAELAETAQRSYTAEDDAAMEIIKDPKEGDLCTLTSGDVYTYHLGEWVLLTDPITAEEVTDIVDGKISDLLDGAPETMDTLKEVADAIAANKNVGDALTAAIGNKVNKENGKGLSANDYTDEDKAKLGEASKWHREGASLAERDAYTDVTDGCEFVLVRSAAATAKLSTLQAGDVVTDIRLDKTFIPELRDAYSSDLVIFGGGATIGLEITKLMFNGTPIYSRNYTPNYVADADNMLAAFALLPPANRTVRTNRCYSDYLDGFFDFSVARNENVVYVMERGIWREKSEAIIDAPEWLCSLPDGIYVYSAIGLDNFKNVVEILDSGKLIRWKIDGCSVVTTAQKIEQSLPESKTVYTISGTTIDGGTVVISIEANSTYYLAKKTAKNGCGTATTPALLTAADADAMNALTTAKDGDRCIVANNAIYDRVGGTWYFTAGVQPAKTVKASELKAGDKIKAVNFDTSKTPAGTGDGIFCTIGGVPIEMMAFIDSLSYGTGKTPLFTGTWNTANTAACSAAMAGKTVDSVAANMAALSANVDDWLSFEIE